MGVPALAGAPAEAIDGRTLRSSSNRTWRGRRMRRRRGKRRRRSTRSVCCRSTGRSVLTSRSRMPSGRHGRSGVASAPPPLTRRGRGRRLPEPLPLVAALIVGLVTLVQCLRSVPFVCRQAYAARHHGRYGPEGTLRGAVQKNCGFSAVAVHRRSSLFLSWCRV